MGSVNDHWNELTAGFGQAGRIDSYVALIETRDPARGGYGRACLTVVGSQDGRQISAAYRPGDVDAERIVAVMAANSDGVATTRQWLQRMVARASGTAGLYTSPQFFDAGVLPGGFDEAADTILEGRTSLTSHSHGSVQPSGAEHARQQHAAIERAVREVMGDRPASLPTPEQDQEILRRIHTRRIDAGDPAALHIVLQSGVQDPAYSTAKAVVISTVLPDGSAGQPIAVMAVNDSGYGYSKVYIDEQRLAPLNEIAFLTSETEFWKASDDPATCDYVAECEERLGELPPAGPEGPFTPAWLDFLRTKLQGRLAVSPTMTIAIEGSARDSLEVIARALITTTPVHWHRTIAGPGLA